jgi:hypothetical protein
VDFEVQRSEHIGSPRLPGSTSASSRSSNTGSRLINDDYADAAVTQCASLRTCQQPTLALVQQRQYRSEHLLQIWLSDLHPAG